LGNGPRIVFGVLGAVLLPIAIVSGYLFISRHSLDRFTAVSDGAALGVAVLLGALFVYRMAKNLEWSRDFVDSSGFRRWTIRSCGIDFPGVLLPLFRMRSVWRLSVGMEIMAATDATLADLKTLVTADILGLLRETLTVPGVVNGK
jgi:hypothetical protein